MMFPRLENLLISSQRKQIKDYIIYAQLQIINPEIFERILVIIFIVSAIIGGFLAYKYVNTIEKYKILIGVGVGLAIWVFAPYVAVSAFSLLADKTARAIEKALPDMLILMASNIRAGTIPEQAFISSIRPQFGPLNNLLRYAAVEIESGKTFVDAIQDISNLTNSDVFRQSMRIISEGIRSGAEIDRILESLANNLLQEENLMEQMAAEVRSYQLFILGASLFAAPALYGISYIMIVVLTSVTSSVNVQNVHLSTNIGFLSNLNFSKININTSLLQMIYLLNVIIITSAASLISAELQKGDAKEGLVSLPFYVIIGILIFEAIALLGPIMFSQLLHTSIR